MNKEYVYTLTNEEMRIAEQTEKWSPINGKQYFVNGIEVPFKDTLFVTTTKVSFMETPFYSMLSNRAEDVVGSVARDLDFY